MTLASTTPLAAKMARLRAEVDSVNAPALAGVLCHVARDGQYGMVETAAGGATYFAHVSRFDPLTDELNPSDKGRAVRFWPNDKVEHPGDRTPVARNEFS